jgi:hypothetical protein
VLALQLPPSDTPLSIPSKIRDNIEHPRCGGSMMASRPDTDLDRLLEMSIDLLGIGDAAGRLHRVSRSFVRTLGHSEVELLARPGPNGSTPTTWPPPSPPPRSWGAARR